MSSERDLSHAVRALWKNIPTGRPIASGLEKVRSYLDASISSRASQSSITALGTKVDTAETVANTVSSSASGIDTNLTDMETRATNIKNLFTVTNSEPPDKAGSVGSQIHYLADNVVIASAVISAGGTIVKRGVGNLPSSRKFSVNLPTISSDDTESAITEVVNETTEDIYIYSYHMLYGLGINAAVRQPVVTFSLYTGAAGSEQQIALVSVFVSNNLSNVVRSGRLPLNYDLWGGFDPRIFGYSGESQWIYIPSKTRLSMKWKVISGLGTAPMSPSADLLYMTEDDMIAL